MSSISEFFPQLARFPYLAPQSLPSPWFVVFTTLAQREGRLLDFAAGGGEANRRELEAALVPLAVTWLTLDHGAKIAISNSNNSFTSRSPVADAAIITRPGLAVAFTTADCLPLVCVSVQQRVVAAVHAGWRGLAAGVVERTIERLVNDYNVQPETLKIWIGPAIAGEDYEVGGEVRDALLVRPGVSEEQFAPGDHGHFFADLPGVATDLLVSLGVSALAIERYPVSTRQSPLLHSVRRDGTRAGRMATVVGIRELSS